ncbi:MAG: glutamate 5-kinase [Geodermatophilaceae bacterium]|nr:glutamate 5-kinase [Geodermatophilaceae bacterium]
MNGWLPSGPAGSPPIPTTWREVVVDRGQIGVADRLVVKVGSSSLTSLTGGLDEVRVRALADAVAAQRLAGRQIVLVSSGAIAAGMAPLGLVRRPRDLATQQAAASVGQLLLVEQYAAAFARHQLTVGQVLLTADDLYRRAHYRNAQRTLERLLTLGVVPIVNENDAVATDEIRFGDNDRLAALVAHLAVAGALVLLSDIDGLYDGDPRTAGARLITEVHDLSDLAPVDVRASSAEGLGTGGMASKLEAAAIAVQAGVPVLLAAAVNAAEALAGEPVGTFFAASGRRPTMRLFWLRHASSPRGRLHVDDGAVNALVSRRTSLLAAGITAVSGDFAADDPVDVIDAAGRVVARGLVGYDADELPSLLGRRSADLPAEYRRAVVHRDDMVLL